MLGLRASDAPPHDSKQRFQKQHGDNNSTLSRIRDATDCRIIVGDNGRVWIHGDAEAMHVARQLIQTLNEEGHKKTFQSAVEALENERGEH